ncbi:MAG: metal-dependent transcriptional regulator, partial [Anaerolineales bacterium]|nr:metal-dependent transcriptional regulator [Anaerolineales bacterium]
MERPTPIIENYLSVIYTLERDQEPVIGARLADWFEVSAPTVTATIKRMIRDGWVTMDDRKEIHLTKTGRKAAMSVLRRHMLTETMLARLLKVPWSKVHLEADDMEHTISRETMERMSDRLDAPQTCPHGNPLPGFEELMENWTRLTEVEAGQVVVIQRIHESAETKDQLMMFLEDNGLVPGTEVLVENVIAFNETLSLKVGQHVVVLGFPVAKHIFVQHQESGS